MSPPNRAPAARLPVPKRFGRAGDPPAGASPPQGARPYQSRAFAKPSYIPSATSLPLRAEKTMPPGQMA